MELEEDADAERGRSRGWDEGGGNLREEGLKRPLAGNGGLLSDIFRGSSISGKRRSASGPGGGKLEEGLSLAGDRGLSGQWRGRVSIIRKRKCVFQEEKRAWGR